MALAWISVDAQLAQRKVTHRLLDVVRMSGGLSYGQSVDVPRDLLVVTARGLLVGLWGGVANSCSDGDVSDVPDSLLEAWGGWWGAPGVFAQWVRQHHVSDGRIRDWDEMNGTLETRREKDRERKRAEREAQRVLRTVQGPSTDSPEDVGVEGRQYIHTTNHTTKREEQGAPPQTPPPAPAGRSALPARQERTVKAIVEHVGIVLAEVKDGAREALSADQHRTICAELVFAYWAAKTNHAKALLDDSRERRIKSRLQENKSDVSELLYAIDGSLKEPWHNGKKDGVVHQEVDHIFRSRERIEMLANLLPGYKRGEAHPTAIQYGAAMEVRND